MRSLPRGVRATIRTRRSSALSTRLTRPFATRRSTAILIEPGVRLMIGPIVLTGKGPLCRLATIVCTLWTLHAKWLTICQGFGTFQTNKPQWTNFGESSVVRGHFGGNESLMKDYPEFSAPQRQKARSERSPRMPRPWSLFPPPAERLIELNETLIFVVARLGQSQFRIEQRPLAVENLEVIGGSSPISHQREAYGVLKILDGLLVTRPDILILSIRDESV